MKKIAIHHRAGSFSERWIDYCKKKNIDYKIVDVFDTDIINQVIGYDIFMWHPHHADHKDVLASKNILFALEHSGVTVFPNFNTAWHFDDKVAQKYLFESINENLVPSYIFYDENEAITWANNTSYPKVFKLKGGAGSSNVKLAKTKNDALKLIKKSFGKGFKQFDPINYLKENLRKSKSSKDTVLAVAKGLFRIVVPTTFSKNTPPERNYAYFQDFIENDGFDVRVVVINKKAVALKRLVRENDFRASGSGNLVFENEEIDKRYIKKAFQLSEKLGSQSIAIDFVHSKSDEILLVEISYGFPMLNFLEKSDGYWDRDLAWNTGKFNMQEWMIEGLLEQQP